MASINFNRDMTFEYGRLEPVTPGVRRLVLPNPSAFTFHGTGVYVVGSGSVAVIDPGPADPAFTDAIMAGLSGETVEAILITHTHRDHSPGAAPLKRLTGAPTYGFGPHGGDNAEASVEEGADRDFRPDIPLADGQTVAGTGWTLTALHTPGHTSNHLCFAYAEGDGVFSGDHVMGWSTTVVSPPDGDMAAYMASLEKIRNRTESVFWPTHGPPIPSPADYVTALIEHRKQRERQILACLDAGHDEIPAMVRHMYADIPDHLHAAAGRSVLSHMVKMANEGTVSVLGGGPPTIAARYARA